MEKKVNGVHMSKESRAKQFMPFAALKGFEEAIHAREHVVVDKAELSEERLLELDQVIHQIKPGDMASVIYYDNKEYLKVTGIVTRLDKNARIIQIVNKKIHFDNIYDIQK